MDYKKAVFVDTSGFKAWVDEKDDFHDKTKIIVNKLLKNEVVFVTSNFTLDETWTLLRCKCKMEKVRLLKKYLTESIPIFRIFRISADDEARAWTWFDEKDWSGLSFTDCVSFAMMKRLGIKKVLGFDKHFEKAGFRLERQGNQGQRAREEGR